MNQIAPSAAIGFIHCQGPELMSCGWRCADPSGYLDDLHGLLGITATQEPAWNDYVDAVKLASEQMQHLPQPMYQPMGMMSWQERRDMINRMFEVRQQSHDVVHAAAEELLLVLGPTQLMKAATRLPGLAGPRTSFRV